MDGYQRLAAAFADWVDSNGWTQTEVVMRGGPSTSTQTKVRSGHGPLRSDSLRQVDTLMGWPHGTARRVTQGATPPPPSLEKIDLDAITFNRPPGLSDTEWDEVRERMTSGWEWELSARTPRRGTPSKHQHDSQAMAGENSQDNGTDDPA